MNLKYAGDKIIKMSGLFQDDWIITNCILFVRFYEHSVDAVICFHMYYLSHPTKSKFDRIIKWSLLIFNGLQVDG